MARCQIFIINLYIIYNLCRHYGHYVCDFLDHKENDDVTILKTVNKYKKLGLWRHYSWLFMKDRAILIALRVASFWLGNVMLNAQFPITDLYSCSFQLQWVQSFASMNKLQQLAFAASWWRKTANPFWAPLNPCRARLLWAEGCSGRREGVWDRAKRNSRASALRYSWWRRN